MLGKLFQIRDGVDSDAEKSFPDHMDDLWWTLLKIASAWAIGAIVAFCFSSELLTIMKGPLNGVVPRLNNQLIVTSVAGTFVLTLKLAGRAGLILAFPFILYFIADFILPVRTKLER